MGYALNPSVKYLMTKTGKKRIPESISSIKWDRRGVETMEAYVLRRHVEIDKLLDQNNIPKYNGFTLLMDYETDMLSPNAFGQKPGDYTELINRVYLYYNPKAEFDSYSVCHQEKINDDNILRSETENETKWRVLANIIDLRAFREQIITYDKKNKSTLVTVAVGDFVKGYGKNNAVSYGLPAKLEFVEE